MKVLLVNHPGTRNFRGGDLTQLRKTAEALNALGVETGESFDPEPDTIGYDIAHVFNLRTYQATQRQVHALRRGGLRVVMSPIYLDPSVPLWADRVVRKLFTRPVSPAQLEHGLAQLATRTFQVKANNGATWTAHTRNRPRPDYDEAQKAILRQVAWLLPNSHLEMDSLIKTLGPFQGNFTVVPYAVDPKVFLDPDPEPFVQKHGLRDFVLQVGRIEASKNQLLLCYALRDSGLPLVLIGGCMQPEYREWCRRHAGPDLTILDHLPPEELRSAYAAARVHALPSWIETCGLVTMEAALAGCNIVASSAGYELEYWGDLAYYCDPADYRSIAQAVCRAFHNHPGDAGRRQQLRDRILRDYTWERAARLCLEAYEQTAGRCPLAPCPTSAAPSSPGPEGGRNGHLQSLGLWYTGAEDDTFLDAYLHHGEARRLVPVVPSPDAASRFEGMWKVHAGVKTKYRRYHLVSAPTFHRHFLPDPPTRHLHFSDCLDPAVAWARHTLSPHSVALSGTAGLPATVEAVQAYMDLLTSPVEPYDTLICPSEAVRDTVRAVTDSFASFLRDRHGGNPTLRARLAVIYPGVDAQQLRPSTPGERDRLRQSVGIEADEVVALYVGRVSFHAAASPYPMYQGLYQAARATGKKVRLLLAGPVANENVHRAFLDGARVFAPTVRTTTIDLSKPGARNAIWHVADLFTALPDCLNGPPAQVILEAMASGLPVVASDWGSTRELVLPGETGLLVPTSLLQGAGADLTTRLLLGAFHDDAFLAAASQTVVVDCAKAAEAYALLTGNPDLCRRLGEAGRRRVLERFSWEKIIPAYDALWKEQEAERASWATRANGAAGRAGPPCFPVPEVSFAALATRVSGGDDLVRAVPENDTRLHRLLSVAITCYASEERVTDPVTLRRVLNAAVDPVPLRELDEVLRKAGAAPQTSRATLAWMLKYALLQLTSPAIGADRAIDSEGEHASQEGDANGAAALHRLKAELQTNARSCGGEDR